MSSAPLPQPSPGLPRSRTTDVMPPESESVSRTDLSILDLMVLVAENWKLLLLGPLLAGILALAGSFLLTPKFVSTARIMPPQQSGVAAMLASQMGAAGLAAIASAAGGIKSPSDQFVAMLRSRTIFDGVIEQFALRELYGTNHIEETRNALDGRVAIAAGVKDGLISVEVEDTDPERAANMANAFIALLAEMVRKLPISEASQRREFFQKQLSDAKNNLERAEIALRSSDVDRSMLKAEPRAALDEVAQLKAAATVAEMKVAAMRGSMAENHPDLRQARQELESIRLQLNRAEKGGITSNGNSGDYIRKYREFKYNELLFDLMARQYELARIEESRDNASIQVIDVAVPAEWKSKPKRALIAVVTTIASGMLLFAVLLIRMLFQSASSDPASRVKIGRLRKALGRTE
jgi:tyrosine-protein kinase Etk/Wzc